MKRIIVVSAVVLMGILSFSSPSFAQLRKDVGSCQGRVVGVNYSKQEILVRDSETNSNMAFIVDPSVISTMQEGLEVIVIYKKGTNAVRMVKILSAKPAPVAAAPVAPAAAVAASKPSVPAASATPASKTPAPADSKKKYY